MNMNYLAIWVIGLAAAITVAILVIRWFVNYVYDTYEYSVIDWPSLITLTITMILSCLIILPLMGGDTQKVYKSDPDTRWKTKEGRAIADAANAELDATLMAEQVEREATIATNLKITLWFNALVVLVILIRNSIKTSWICAIPVTVMQIIVVTVMVPMAILAACKVGDVANTVLNFRECTK
jgi:hypothetical protein